MDYQATVALDFGTTYSGISVLVKIGDGWKGPYMVKEYEREGQTKTRIVLKADYSFVAFGLDSEKAQAKAQPGAEATLLFDRFKMSLYDSKTRDLKWPLEVKDSTGRSHEAEPVFVAALKHLKEKATTLVERATTERLEPKAYRWVLTVPAIWKTPARLKMKEWARKAGLWGTDQNQLEIALEPEAASLYCIKHFFPKPKVPFLVLDCGGGTLDAVVHYVDEKKKGVHELGPPFGNDGGSTSIDLAFEELMSEILEAKTITGIKEEIPANWFKFLEAFVTAKETWKGLDANVYFSPSKFNKVIENLKPRGCTSFAECVADHKLLEFEVDEDEGTHILVIPEAVMKKLFDASVNKLKELLTGNLKTIQDRANLSYDRKLISEKTIQHVFLVGGLCESDYIWNTLNDYFSDPSFPFHAKLSKPLHPISAVLAGAVLHGAATISTSSTGDVAVLSRISPLTYGVMTNPPWREEHKVEKKYIGSDGVPLCRDVFTVMVKEGDRVVPGQVIQKSFKPLDSSQACIRVFQSTDPAVVYTTDSTAQEAARITVDTSKATSPEILVSLEFGSTSLKVTVNEKATGCPLESAINYDGEAKIVDSKLDSESSEASHIILVVDHSGSMAGTDIRPKPGTIVAEKKHQNRLGCVIEEAENMIKQRIGRPDLFSLVAFQSKAVSVFERNTISQLTEMVLKMKELEASGGTSFVQAFTKVGELLQSRSEIKIRKRVFFLTDGEDASPAAAVRQLMASHPDLRIWCVKFGEAGKDQILKEIASIGLGQFRSAKDAAQLEKTMSDFVVQELK